MIGRQSTAAGHEVMNEDDTTIARKISGRTYSVDVPAFDRKGELAVADDDLHRAELAIAAGIAEDGAISADAFRFMRKAIPLTAAELGRLITVSPETISRWENGVRDIDPLAFFALATLSSRRPRNRTTRARACNASPTATSRRRNGASRHSRERSSLVSCLVGGGRRRRSPNRSRWAIDVGCLHAPRGCCAGSRR